MTGTRKVTFEQDQLPGVSDIELEVEYTYEYTPGRNRIDPDDSYPDEVESEIELEKGWEEIVMAAYVAAAREAIKAIEFNLVPDLNFDNKPKQWAREDANNEQ